MSRKKIRKPAVSMIQARQRELAWMLYITEGYIANMEHALAVNCVTFENADHDRATAAISHAREAAEEIRNALNNL